MADPLERAVALLRLANSTASDGESQTAREMLKRHCEKHGLNESVVHGALAAQEAPRYRQAHQTQDPMPPVIRVVVNMQNGWQYTSGSTTSTGSGGWRSW
jgi:hypothetical protein